MSIRPTDVGDKHVFIRGSMVSLDQFSPSMLNRAFLEEVGLPNSRGFLTVDKHILHVRWVHGDADLIAVYCVATPVANPEAGGWGSGGGCVLS